MVVEIYGDMKDIIIRSSQVAGGCFDIEIDNIKIVLTKDQTEALYNVLDEKLWDTPAQELQDKLDDIEQKYNKLKEDYSNLQEKYNDLHYNQRFSRYA